MSKITVFDELRGCRLCADELPMSPRPIFQCHPRASILIAGQAPGRITQEKGIPFDDPSGNRLRDWMGIDREVFYDAKKIAILPMAFCFPGSGRSGDLPPPPRCAETWRARLLAELPNLKLTLVIGQYAMSSHMPNHDYKNLTETVRHWREFDESILPLPHPSPRNNIWLKKNPWFEEELLPEFKTKVAALI